VQEISINPRISTVVFDRACVFYFDSFNLIYLFVSRQ